MGAAFVAVAEIGGGVKQRVMARQAMGESLDIGHVALDPSDWQGAELALRLFRTAHQRGDLDPAIHQKADQIVPEQTCRAGHEGGFHV